MHNETTTTRKCLHVELESIMVQPHQSESKRQRFRSRRRRQLGSVPILPRFRFRSGVAGPLHTNKHL